jgi:hypothetical protein
MTYIGVRANDGLLPTQHHCMRHGRKSDGHRVRASEYVD